MSRSTGICLRFVAIFFSYLLAAKVGQAFALNESMASPVWPPSGIALCALLLFGRQYWPAIFLAGTTFNAFWLLDTPGADFFSVLLTAPFFGLGSVTEAILGHRLLTILNGSQSPIQRGHRVAWIIPVGLLVSAVGALMGCATIIMAGSETREAASAIFLTWWIGDTSGILIITPIIIGWSARWRSVIFRRKMLEILGYFMAIGIGGLFLFTLPQSSALLNSLPLLMSPLLMWSAFRYAPPVTAFASLLIAGFAIWGTLEGFGPLRREADSESFLALQIFLCINAIISITVTASFAFQKRIAFSLAHANDTLEKRIGERTEDLAAANESLSQKISEKECAEASLLLSEQRYKDVAEAASDWLWELDGELRIVNASKGLTETIGISTDKLLGRKILELEHADTSDRGNAHSLKELLDSHEPFRNVELTICATDGARRNLQLSGKPLFSSNGGFSGYRGLGVDITAHETTRKLAESLGQILNESLNEIYLLSTDSLRCIQANRGVLKNLQFSADEIRDLDPVHFLPEFTEDTLRNLLSPLLDHSKDRLSIETFHLRADGTRYPVELQLQYSEFADESAFLAVAMDISQKKALQNQLVRAQKLESIGQLAAGVAHEINTPTQYVSDNARFLRDSFNDILPVLDSADAIAASQVLPGTEDIERLRAALDKADLEFVREEVPKAFEQSLDGLGRIAEIVRAMKDFSHPGSGEKELSNVNEIINNAITVSASEWKYVAELQVELADDIPLVPCLRGEMGQVILNMLVNAAHAIVERHGDGGAQKGLIQLKTTPCSEGVLITINDNGAGIPSELQEKVFDLFFTTKPVGKGTGQGLSLAHTVVVEKHGGTINIESIPGLTTEFQIVLPATPQVTGITEAAA